MLYRGETDLSLPPKAVETLIALIESRGEIVAKEDLIKSIWGDTVVEESNLAHHLHVLRKALGRRSDGREYVETFRRRGYLFTLDVRVVATPNACGKNAEQNEQSNGFAETRTESRVRTGSSPVFSPLLGAIAVLTGLLASAAIWYFQRQDLSTHGISSPRGEISITPLTNGIALLAAAISPDGKHFAYHEIDNENKAHMWVQQTGQTGRVEVIAPREWAMGGKTFSPDSDFVYFTGLENGEKHYSLYRVATLGGPLTKVLTNIRSAPSFSPDGREMVFARYDEAAKESRLVIASDDGSRERVLLTRPGNSMSNGNAWSPDGNLVAFETVDRSSLNTKGGCALQTVEIKSGEVKEISPERWDTCYGIAWTPDGKGLVFIGTRADEIYTTRRDQIYYLSFPEGQSRRISSDGARYQDLSLGITADNSILAVPNKMFSQIWVMDANGEARTAEQLTNGQMDGSSGIAPLPDGRIGYLSRIGGNRTLWIMNADGSDQHQIGEVSPFIEELRATPDGRYFIFASRRDGYSHLFRIGTDGQNLTQLTDGETGEIDSTISPDGRWVYYVSSVKAGEIVTNYLRKTEIEDGRTVDLKQLFCEAPYISPDGKLISGNTADGLKIFSTSDGTVVNSLKTEKGAIFSNGAKWTPDGRSVTYLVERNNSVNIWVQNITGSPARQLTKFPKGYLYSHAYSHDGTKLYLARGYQVRDAVLIKNF